MRWSPSASRIPAAPNDADCGPGAGASPVRSRKGGGTLSGVRPWLALSAALLSVAAGLIPWQDSCVERTHWPWQVDVAGLENAPVTPGRHVIVVPPPDATKETRVFWVYEARWRRPDVHWCLPEEWPLKRTPNLWLTVRATDSPPDGWTAVWRMNGLNLIERGSGR